MAKQKLWEELTEHTKKQLYYAKDPRCPEDYRPPAGPRCQKSETLPWMEREKVRLETRLKIINFKIGILRRAEDGQQK